MANTVANGYAFVEPQLGAAKPDTNCSTTVNPGFRLGVIGGAQDPNLGYGEFMFCCGATASAPTAGDFVLINGGTAMQAVSGNTGSRGPMGIAMAAMSGTAVSGWVQIYGQNNFCNLGTQGVGTVASPVCIGTTAGRAQTTGSATGFVIDGAWIGGTANYSTTNSNSGFVYLDYPAFNGIH